MAEAQPLHQQEAGDVAPDAGAAHDLTHASAEALVDPTTDPSTSADPSIVYAAPAVPSSPLTHDQDSRSEKPPPAGGDGDGDGSREDLSHGRQSPEEEEEDDGEGGTDDGEEEEEDDDDEEEEDDEDEEPKLKYQRLAGTLSDTLKKDAVSTMAVSDRFLALGTHWGVVHILDLNGNDVKKFEAHSATVNEISIDTNGEYIASASDDGNSCLEAQEKS
ncbi:hypothetical protein HK405_003882 [Cladochytrium tenue]|nr:hypothetical protein HK405_003882 [Cladochytrium tenue]